jgi:DNA-directed RNA polymerase subunit RPC12/RpoP
MFCPDCGKENIVEIKNENEGYHFALFDVCVYEDGSESDNYCDALKYYKCSDCDCEFFKIDLTSQEDVL